MRRASIRVRVSRFTSGVLVGMESWLDRLPEWVMPELRDAVKSELLARQLAAIAEESGGWPCVPIGGIQ